MEAFALLLSIYWRLIAGFAGAAIGMQLILTQWSRSSDMAPALLCLATGWYSAVFGTPYGAAPQNVMTPNYRYRVYWIGVVVFVIGSALPIAWDVFRFGVRDRNVVAMTIIALAVVLAAGKSWFDARSDARRGDRN